MYKYQKGKSTTLYYVWNGGIRTETKTQVVTVELGKQLQYNYDRTSKKLVALYRNSRGHCRTLQNDPESAKTHILDDAACMHSSAQHMTKDSLGDA